MALVGDILVRCRENGPDPASYIGRPTFSVSAVAPGFGFLPLPTGTYWIVLTTLNQWGESLPSAEQSIAIAASQNILISTVVLPIGATGYRVYLARPDQGPGSEAGYVSVQGSGNTQIGVTAIAGTSATGLDSFQSGVPPVRATGMMPDTDGGFVSAWSLYRWLNSAIQKAVKVSGGVQLVTGVQAVAGQGMYRIPGKWVHFTAGWFDGWPITFGRKGDVFIRQSMTGISGLTTMEEIAQTTVFQMWPQPNRTGATAMVSSPIDNIQTSVPVTSTVGFLGLGLVQIDNEIMSYFSLTPPGGGAGAFQQVLRGVGGTIAVSHLANAPVTELNIRLSGFTLPPEYGPGDSGKTLPIPPAWEEPLTDYITAQFKKSELDSSTAAGIEKAFDESIRQIVKESRPPTGPAQIGSATREVYPGGYGGGILLP